MQTYPQDPYYMGRWSNGPVWIEIVANQMGVVLRDYAAAGATSGTAPARKALHFVLARLLLTLLILEID